MLSTIKVELNKGVILLNEKTRLGNNKIKSKFFIVMEKKRKHQKRMLIFMTTSRSKNNPTDRIEIYLPFPTKSTTNVLLRIFKDEPIWKLNKFYIKKGVISDEQIEVLDNAIKSAKFIQDKIKKRVLYQEEKRIEKRKKTYNKLWSKEEAFDIKLKLGLKTKKK
ncbi:MAG: hypothetical protein ABH819_00780 [Patescibacteria group bacterium]|nr:hypothetical protein [Patescibacteria group bacterium]